MTIQVRHDPGDSPSSAGPPARDAAHLADRVQSHLDAVWRYLRMLGAKPQQADDLSQEAFVVALRKGVLEAEPAALRTFLRRTARFLWLQSFRSSTQEIEVADAVDLIWDQECIRDDGSALVDAARNCIEQLESRPRRAIELAYGLGNSEESSRKAIAEALGMKENGVKTLLHRLRESLRGCIERRVTG